MAELGAISLAIAGGILPALAWLWFWRREDSKHPEPRRLIALAFLAGMLAVGIVIPLERLVQPYLDTQVLVFSVWSALEEIVKYLAAYFSVLNRDEDDEPMDPVIYMVSVALGFAALENVLFLTNPALSGQIWTEILQTGDLRFIGATLLHVLSSAVIGIALGLSFYKKTRVKRAFVFWGLILACALHALFNFLILNAPPEHMLRTFGFVWIGLIGVLAILEYIKRIRPAIRNKNSRR